MDPTAEPQIVMVEWLDSGMAIGAEWKTLDEFVAAADAAGAMLVTTIGYLIHEDEQHILVAQSRDAHNGNYLNAQVLYRPTVKSVQPLTPGEPE